MFDFATFAPVAQAVMVARLKEAGFPMREAESIVRTAARAKRDRRG